MFLLGAIDPLLVGVGGYEGFDLPSFASLTSLLSDGVSTRNQVIQSGSEPLRAATISGTLVSSADVAQFREYNRTKEAIAFVDGNGVTWTVRVMDLHTVDFVDWWTFTASLVESPEAPSGGIGGIGSGDGTPDADGETEFTDLDDWTLVFAEEFDVDVALGHILDGSPDAYHTADNRYTFYKSSWTDTTGHGHYDPSIVSIHDSMLDIAIQTRDGFPRVCAFTPHPPGSTSKGGLTTGGRFFARIMTDLLPSYKGVPMWWADDSVHGEFDGPESNLNATPKAYMHPTAGISTGQVIFTYPPGTSWQDWHDYECAWTADGDVEYFLDGVSIGSTPTPAAIDGTLPLHCNMQFETQLVYSTAGIPSPSVSGHVYIDRLALWVPA